MVVELQISLLYVSGRTAVLYRSLAKSPVVSTGSVEKFLACFVHLEKCYSVATLLTRRQKDETAAKTAKAKPQWLGLVVNHFRIQTCVAG